MTYNISMRDPHGDKTSMSQLDILSVVGGLAFNGFSLDPASPRMGEKRPLIGVPCGRNIVESPRDNSEIEPAFIQLFYAVVSAGAALRELEG